MFPLVAGRHVDVSAQEYHSWDAVSNSQLTQLKRSPAHLAVWKEHPEGQWSKAKQLGTAIHYAILQPDLFHKRYLVEPPNNKRTLEGKATYAKFLEASAKGGTLVLAQKDYQACLRARDAVYAHPEAADLLQGVREVSYLYETGYPNLFGKARIDNELEDILVDCKSTRDARRPAFSRAIFQYGYHRQAAKYLYAAECLGRRPRHFCLIAYEPEPPYGVAVYRLTDSVVEYGRAEVLKLIEQYFRCRHENHYPAYPGGIHDIELPSWARREDALQLAFEGEEDEQSDDN